MNRIFLFFYLITANIFPQDELLDFLGEEPLVPFPVQATFKSTRIVNAQSLELPRAKTLEFMIQHRFGKMKNGFYDLFGMDEATVHYDLKYAFNKRLAFGLGRSSWKKTYDLMIKWKMMRQMEGKGKAFPLTAVFFSNIGINALKKDNVYKEKFSNRIHYIQQLILGRKFNEIFSIQFSPTWIHKNLVTTNEDQHDLFSTVLGGRIKFAKHYTLTGDISFPFGNRSEDYKNGWGIGLNIETGGHVFQLILTNARGGYEGAYIEDAKGSLDTGDIFLGFNITRVFIL
tara:strand:+ start:20586 stop:21443 length:858 start_codon:yes stop_codon:yes gene_type:complete